MRFLRCCVKRDGKMTLTVSNDLDGSGRGSPQACEAQEATGQLRFSTGISQIQCLLRYRYTNI
jgi:hypothetical protein